MLGISVQIRAIYGRATHGGGIRAITAAGRLHVRGLRGGGASIGAIAEEGLLGFLVIRVRWALFLRAVAVVQIAGGVIAVALSDTASVDGKARLIAVPVRLVRVSVCVRAGVFQIR